MPVDSTSELESLSVITRDSLHKVLIPGLTHAISLTGSPISVTRAKELERVLRGLQTEAVSLANLHRVFTA